MQINVPREFRLESVPATVRLNEDDLTELLGEFPAELSVTDRTGTFTFESPRAAADFVDSLDGQIPYSTRNMTDAEAEIFAAPEMGSVAREIVAASAAHLGGADKVARRWGVAGFSVAVSGAAVALTALVLSIVALVLV